MVAETVTPPGSIIISPTQMYNELRVVSDGLKQLVTLVDPALSGLREDLSDHEKRIRTLERKQYVVGAAATAFGAGIAQLLNVFT